MSGLTTQSFSQQANTKELVLMRKLMIATEFILHSDLEDQYVEFLQDLLVENDWLDFQAEILEDIFQYQITDTEIHNNIKNLVKIPSKHLI
jgi:hypothetical protein